MLLIGCSLTLLVIYAGMKLMAQTEKDNLGKMYKYVSMFIIVMGFLMLVCIACCGIMRCCHGGGRMMQKNMRMERNFNGGCMDGQMGHHNMMFKRRINMNGCCEEMNMGGGCESEMDACCNEHKGCNKKMLGKCHGEKEECCEESEECEMKKDTVVKIIKKK